MKHEMTMASTVLLVLAACQDMPTFTHSGDVKTITIEDRLSDAAVQVHAGDQIRWTNMSIASVRITFLDYVLNKVSCRHNFSGHFYSGAEASLQPNQSASMCFREPGTIRYVVRMQSTLPGGVIDQSGQVHIEARMDPAPDTSDALPTP